MNNVLVLDIRRLELSIKLQNCLLFLIVRILNFNLVFETSHALKPKIFIHLHFFRYMLMQGTRILQGFGPRFSLDPRRKVRPQNKDKEGNRMPEHSQYQVRQILVRIPCSGEPKKLD